MFRIPPGWKTEQECRQLLRKKCQEKLSYRYPKESKAAKEAKAAKTVSERLERELTIIGDKGFSSYFLVVDDIVQRAPRTCGRGSAAARWWTGPARNSRSTHWRRSTR